MAGVWPETEQELARELPASSIEGVFPRSALLGDERVIYETRARIAGLRPVLFWGTLALAVFFWLSFLAGLSLYGHDPATIASVGILLFLTSAPFLAVLLSAWRTSYALTDQRILVRRGGEFETALLVEVSAVRMGANSSSVIFDLTPASADPNRGFLAARRQRIDWRGLSGAPAVAAFAQRAVNFYQLVQRQAKLRESVVSAALAKEITCEYCGGLIQVSTLSPTDPRCPNCRAPILTAAAPT